MKITIETIPHKNQRYPTCGDYFIDTDGTIQIRVSKMKEDYEVLVIIHELIELFLCKKRKISFTSIDDFDQLFEDMRKLYPDIVKDKEPGNDTSAPYFYEHKFATEIEEKMAQQLGVMWQEYEKTVNEL